MPQKTDDYGQNNIQRSKNGQFAKGNKIATGNPVNCRTAMLRAHILAQVTAGEWAAITRQLVEMALGGDLQAIREILDRGIGRPHQSVTLDAPERPVNQDASIVGAYISLGVVRDKWAPGILARYDAGMIEGHSAKQVVSTVKEQ